MPGRAAEPSNDRRITVPPLLLPPSLRFAPGRLRADPRTVGALPLLLLGTLLGVSVRVCVGVRVSAPLRSGLERAIARPLVEPRRELDASLR